MAANKGGKKASSSSGGGMMMGMRSGFRKMAGRDGKGRRKEVTFWQVLMIVAGIALLGLMIWGFRR